MTRMQIQPFRRACVRARACGLTKRQIRELMDMAQLAGSDMLYLILDSGDRVSETTGMPLADIMSAAMPKARKTRRSRAAASGAASVN